jgi:hypothetical protein
MARKRKLNPFWYQEIPTSIGTVLLLAVTMPALAVFYYVHFLM